MFQTIFSIDHMFVGPTTHSHGQEFGNPVNGIKPLLRSFLNSCLKKQLSYTIYQNQKNSLKQVKQNRISTRICMQVDTYETQFLTKCGVMGTYFYRFSEGIY